MKTSKIKLGLVSFTALVFVTLSMPLFAYAKSAQALETGNGSDNTSQGGATGDNGNGQVVQVATGKLEGNKLDACQKRERVITATMARVQDRSQKQLAVFDKISERVQAFYAAKGYTLSNYDELVTEANAKRVEAQNATQAMAQNGAFDCEGDGPKGVLDGFKTRAMAQNGALKGYRTAVQNLIEGVKSAALEVTE